MEPNKKFKLQLRPVQWLNLPLSQRGQQEFRRDVLVLAANGDTLQLNWTPSSWLAEGRS